MSSTYTIAVSEFLASGKEGYVGFLDPSVIHLPPSSDEAHTI